MPSHVSSEHLQTPASGRESVQRFVASLKRVRSAKTMELHQKRLSFLAQHYDPFQITPSDECAQIIAHYGLDTSNPFEFTNTLLQMLDALEEKQRLLHA